MIVRVNAYREQRLHRARQLGSFERFVYGEEEQRHAVASGGVEIAHIFSRCANGVAVVFCDRFGHREQLRVLAKVVAAGMHVGGELIVTPFLHASADGQKQHKDKRKRQEKAANDKEPAPKSREQKRENRGSAEECDKHPVSLR